MNGHALMAVIRVMSKVDAHNHLLHRAWILVHAPSHCRDASKCGQPHEGALRGYPGDLT